MWMRSASACSRRRGALSWGVSVNQSSMLLRSACRPSGGALVGACHQRLQQQQCRSLSAGSSAAHLEMGTILDPFNPDQGYLKGWANFSASTMAIVQLRGVLSGWGVPMFKEESARIYTDVGVALAARDEKKLRELTTPSCFKQLIASMRKRPKGQRQRWETDSVVASVRQVRIGHHKSSPERKFAQVTCSIDAKIIWTIMDSKGAIISGVGSEDEPHEVNDLWVFERCISQAVEPPRWRLKQRLNKAPTQANTDTS